MTRQPLSPRSTYRPDFGGVWAKIDRAREHTQALNREIGVGPDGIPTPFSAIHRIPIRLDYEPDTGQHVFSTAAAPPEDVLRRWSIITGDAIHNLRSALDHLFWQLALVASDGKVPWTDRQIREIQFPLTDTPEWFTKSKALKYITPGHRAIIKEHQPHGSRFDFSRGAIHPFSKLRDLSNLDKHRLIIEAPALADNLIVDTAAIFGNAGGEIIEEHDGNGIGHPLARDAEIMRVKVRPASLQLNMEVVGYIAMEPSLKDVLPNGTLYVRSVGIELLQITRQTVELIRQVERAP